MREPIVCLGGGERGGWLLGCIYLPGWYSVWSVKDDGMRKAEPRKKRGKERKDYGC